MNFVARFLLVLTLIFGASSVSAMADSVERPMIEVGTGVEGNPSQSFDVLLRVRVEGAVVHPGTLPPLVVARISGDLGFSTETDGRRLPYFDIQFLPLGVRVSDGLRGGEFRVLPGQVGANVRLNRGLSVRVDVVGMQTNHLEPTSFNDRLLIFTKLAVDALGYKVATHVTDAAHFYGFNLAALNGEVGAVLAVEGGFKVRVAFGASADLSIGTTQGAGFSVLSDMSFYNEVSVDIRKFLRVFLRNGLNLDWQSGYGTQAEYQLLAGATFIF